MSALGLQLTSRARLLHVVDWIAAVLARAVARCLYRRQVRGLVQAVAEARRRVLASTPSMDFSTCTDALVAVEDRRFYEHCGVDCKAVVRALGRVLLKGEIQGGSTITQQLVRLLTRDYRRSMRRKVKEVCLACTLDKLVPKGEQAVLYLFAAYYGWRMNGIRQAIARLRIPVPVDREGAAQIVARLRYPEPSRSSAEQAARIERRVAYIRLLTERRASDGRS